MGTFSKSELEAMESLSAAVIVATWSEVKEPAVAVNVAFRAPAEIETVGGTVILPLALRATEIGCSVGAFRVTVQMEEEPGPRVDGVQETAAITNAVFPVADAEITEPSTETGMGFETPTVTEPTPGASSADTLAMGPSEMRNVLIPVAKHV
jgi:hypothetical protein